MLANLCDKIYHDRDDMIKSQGGEIVLKFIKYTIGLLLLFGGFAAADNLGEIGIDDSRLGQKIPMDLRFYDESDSSVSLAELAQGKPFILALVYYNCTSICNPFLNAIVDVVNQSPTAFLPGEKYNIIAVSFDPDETAEIAREKKLSYYNQFREGMDLPADAFRFLTGDSSNIRRLTEAVGFLYKEDSTAGFLHASSIIVISPSGIISRYIRGLSFLPVEIIVSITNAMEGKWAPTLKKVVQFCFAEEPDGRGYYFDFLKVTGVLIILSIIITTLVLSYMVKRKPVDVPEDKDN